jgi:molecular chaperone GrpE (heat shock protein)
MNEDEREKNIHLEEVLDSIAAVRQELLNRADGIENLFKVLDSRPESLPSWNFPGTVRTDLEKHVQQLRNLTKRTARMHLDSGKYSLEKLKQLLTEMDNVKNATVYPIQASIDQNTR